MEKENNNFIESKQLREGVFEYFDRVHKDMEPLVVAYKRDLMHPKTPKIGYDTAKEFLDAIRDFKEKTPLINTERTRLLFNIPWGVYSDIAREYRKIYGNELIDMGILQPIAKLKPKEYPFSPEHKKELAVWQLDIAEYILSESDRKMADKFWQKFRKAYEPFRPKHRNDFRDCATMIQKGVVRFVGAVRTFQRSAGIEVFRWPNAHEDVDLGWDIFVYPVGVKGKKQPIPIQIGAPKGGKMEVKVKDKKGKTLKSPFENDKDAHVIYMGIEYDKIHGATGEPKKEFLEWFPHVQREMIRWLSKFVGKKISKKKKAK